MASDLSKRISPIYLMCDTNIPVYCSVITSYTHTSGYVSEASAPLQACLAFYLEYVGILPHPYTLFPTTSFSLQCYYL